MRNTLYVIAFIGLCIFTTGGCDRPMSGGPCDQIGSTATDKQGQLWTCVKNQTTGKGYWYKGKY